MRFKSILPIAAILVCCFSGQALAGPVVACGPGQHAVFRNTWVRGEPVTQAVCVGPVYRSPAYYGTPYYGTGYYGPRYYGSRYYGPRYYGPRYYGPRYYGPRYYYRTRYYHGHSYRVRIVVR